LGKKKATWVIGGVQAAKGDMNQIESKTCARPESSSSSYLFGAEDVRRERPGFRLVINWVLKGKKYILFSDLPRSSWMRESDK